MTNADKIKTVLLNHNIMNNDQIILLKCTSSYPAELSEANLLMVKDLSERFNVFSGLSDHTMSNTAPVVATALGAKIIE